MSLVTKLYREEKSHFTPMNFDFGKWLNIYLIITILFLFASCKKFVEVSPPTNSLTKDNVYTSDATAIAVMTGVYTNMSSGAIPFATGIYGLSIGAGLSADEMNIYPGSDLTLTAMYQNTLSSNLAPPYWKSLYKYLYTVNSVITGLTSSNSLTTSIKEELLGEAEFMRAFYYFYLVNLYGDVPLITATDYKANALSNREEKQQIYLQIIADLKDAQKLLAESYLDANLKKVTTERVRPNKWAATALLSRTYLYMGQYDSAAIQASAVINNSSQYSLTTLDKVFLKNSNEAIWQLQPVNSGWNTEDARTLLIPSAGPNTYQNPVYLSSTQISSFEYADQRYKKWTDSVIANSIIYRYPSKYKNAQYGSSVTEYLMVLRLAEQYLIRAEAKAEMNDILGAQVDLNIIRNRAGLPNTSANDKASLLKAILHERQVEYFSEWGQRWLDLKRTGLIDSIMINITPLKGGIWNSDWQVYPIPLSDIQMNPNLTQNQGY